MSDRPLFRFEDFEDIKPRRAQEAAIEAALYELHPKGTPVAALEETLKKAGAEVNKYSDNIYRTTVFTKDFNDNGLEAAVAHESHRGIKKDLLKVAHITDEPIPKVEVTYKTYDMVSYKYEIPSYLLFSKRWFISIYKSNDRMQIARIEVSKMGSFK